MAYSCSNIEPYLNKSYGTGHCVPFVQHCATAPNTKRWRRGIKVRGNAAKISQGTVIATFEAAGTYPNKSMGNHAAIYDGQDETGIWVYDQF